MSVTSCNFCRAQGGCALALTRPYWGELVPTARVINLRKGNVVYREGFPAEGVFLLCRGSIKLTAITDAGTERITGFATCGELFGLDALLPQPVRCMSAVVRETSQGAFITSLAFKKALRSNPDLLWNVTLLLNDLLHRANYEKLTISGACVRDRIENVLLDLSQRLKRSEAANRPSFAKLKQRELAELLGVPEETICRELRKIRGNQNSQLAPLEAGAKRFSA